MFNPAHTFRQVEIIDTFLLIIIPKEMNEM